MPLEPGASIGDYKVIALLGSGGMGQVYKVQNLLSNRIEAMKVLVPDLRNQSDLAERFLREMQVHASLVHPNIASMHTALRLDNQLVMLMEFVEGTTLEERLRAGNLAVRECMDYAQQVLAALAYAHKQGVVHRDIKPANVMVTPEGVVKVMDFGLAAGATDKRLTRAGTVVGSLYYMSPEQVRGETCSAQTDIYSAGLTLYEMLTGVRGIHGETDFALMNAQLTELPEPPTRLNPAIPSSLSEIVLRAVAKNPADRFGSASEFRQALDLAGKPPAISLDLEPTRVVSSPALQAIASTPPAAVSSSSVSSMVPPSPVIPVPATPRSRAPLIAVLVIAVLVGGAVVAYRAFSAAPSASPTATATVVTPQSPAAPTSEPRPASEPPKPAEHPEKAITAEKASVAKATPPPSSSQPTPVSAPPVAPQDATAEPTPPPEEPEQPEPAITPAKREAARNEIAGMLMRLDAAYAAQDFGKVATLWPSGTPEAHGRWANFYSQFRSVAFTFRLNGDPTVQGTHAAVRYHFERTRFKGPAERTLMVRMIRTGGSWLIASINFAGPAPGAK